MPVTSGKTARCWARRMRARISVREVDIVLINLLGNTEQIAVNSPALRNAVEGVRLQAHVLGI